MLDYVNFVLSLFEFDDICDVVMFISGVLFFLCALAVASSLGSILGMSFSSSTFSRGFDLLYSFSDYLSFIPSGDWADVHRLPLSQKICSTGAHTSLLHASITVLQQESSYSHPFPSQYPTPSY